MAAHRARQQRADKPDLNRPITNLNGREYRFFRRAGEAAEAAMLAFQAAQAEVQIAQRNQQESGIAMTEKRAAFVAFATFILEDLKLDPEQHYIRDDGAVMRKQTDAKQDEQPEASASALAPGDSIDIEAPAAKPASERVRNPKGRPRAPRGDTLRSGVAGRAPEAMPA